MVQKKEILIKWVETKDQLADVLTKKRASCTRLMEALSSSHLRHQVITCIHLKIYLLLTWDSQCDFKVVDSCWISSTEWSDTFRSFLYIEKSKNQEKIYIITVQKISPS